MTIDQKIEAILFFKSEPIKIGALASVLEVSDTEIARGLEILEERYARSGINILYNEDKVMLGTNKDASPIIESLVKEELSKDIGKAGLETLSIIIYYGPVARNKIEYIRGVSSTFILRNLLVRGLIEKVQNPKDQRSFLYKPTFELISHLGISKVEDMPEYMEVRNEITAFDVSQDVSEEKDKIQNG